MWELRGRGPHADGGAAASANALIMVMAFPRSAGASAESGLFRRRRYLREARFGVVRSGDLPSSGGSLERSAEPLASAWFHAQVRDDQCLESEGDLIVLLAAALGPLLR